MNSIVEILANKINNVNIEKIPDKQRNINYIDTCSSLNTSDLSYDSNTTSSEFLSDKKVYWEYGNRRLKMRNFDKVMSRNLAIMYYIDRVFCNYGIVYQHSFKKLFNSHDDSKHIYSCGEIFKENGKVYVKLNNDKLKGIFNVKEANLVTISDIKLTYKDLYKNGIPNLESLLSHKDNLHHVLKITRLFNIHNKFKVNSNHCKTSFNEITRNANFHIKDEYEKHNKNNILKSPKNVGFYIKMHNDHAKAFFIDNKNNLIYFITVNYDVKLCKVYIRYYTFDITDGKIIKYEY